jgi:Tfp pilus assembly protein PilE
MLLYNRYEERQKRKNAKATLEQEKETQEKLQNSGK